MNEFGLQIESVSKHLDEKQKKRLQVDVFIRLCKKLEEIESTEINNSIKETFNLLQEYVRDESVKKSQYMKSFNALKKLVRDELGFTRKGQIAEEMTGIGIALGVAIGGGFVGINPAFVGIGLPIGLAIGAGIGRKKEEQAESEGKTY